MIAATQGTGSHSHKGQGQDGNQGQPPIQHDKHGKEGHNGCQRGVYCRHDTPTCRHDQGIDIIGSMSHQIPRPKALEKGRRHAGKMLKEPIAQDLSQMIGCPKDIHAPNIAQAIHGQAR